MTGVPIRVLMRVRWVKDNKIARSEGTSQPRAFIPV